MKEKAVFEGGDYWYVAPTYKQAKLIAWRLLLSYLPEELIAKTNETELTVYLKNNSTISLKGADNPDSLRGVGINGLILDEYAFTDPYAWDVLRPLLTDRKGWVIFISTPNGYNHFYDLWNMEQTSDSFKSFHFTSYDNPYLDPEEIDEAKKSMSSERFDQEYMAEFTKRAGTIWQFNRTVHVVPRRNPDKSSTIIGSIDFGFAIGHPTAIGWHDINSIGDWYTFDGLLQEGLTIEQVDEQMRSQTAGLVIRAIYADSARPDLIEELQKKGWPVIPAKKDVELGISQVGQLMQVNPLTNKPRWTISEHLTGHIRQIEGYVWQDVRGEDGYFKQVPLKREDDAPDMLRYGIFTHTQPQKTRKRIVGYTGGDPVTGYGRTPIYREE